MSKLLYINDQLVDLYPNTVLAQTLQAFEIGEPGSVSVPYTNRIRIPKTATNRRVLEFSDDSKSSTTIPYTKHTARYIENGIEIIRNGIADLKETDEGDFSLSIFSDIGFFDFIKDKKLWDLDFTSLNGFWNLSNIDAVRNATTGIVQPVYDHGRLTFSSPNILNNTDARSKPPWIYFHTVIDKIFETAGYSKSGAIFTDPVYLALAIPLGLTFSPPFVEAKLFRAKAPGTQSGSPPVYTKVTFDQLVFNGADGFYNGADTYVINNPDTSLSYFGFDFTAVVEISLIGGGTVDIKLDLNGSVLQAQLNVGSGLYTLNGSFSGKNGDAVSVQIVNNTGTPTVTVTSGIFYNTPRSEKSGDDFTTTLTTGYVYFNQLFEDINQIAFLKDFTTRFNVLMIERDGVIICKTMNEILADTANQLDWTAKRSNKKNILRYAYDGFFQNNFLDYPDDKHTPNLSEDYAKGSFTIDNENIEESGIIYSSLFKFSEMTTFQNVFMANINMGPTGTFTYTDKLGIRLLFLRDRVPFEPSVIYDSIARSDYKVAYFIDARQANSMHWQFFIDKYYANFVKRLQKAKAVTRDYRLTDVDIHSFDQLKLIHDNGETFIVTKIKNYISGKMTEVELFKVS